MPSFVGAVAHRLFARHYQSGPISDLGQAVREEIGSSLNAKLTAVGIHRPSQLEDTIRTVGVLYERFRRFPGDGFREAEVPLEVEVAPGVQLLGKVDAVFDDGEGILLLRDWKTGPLGDPLVQLMFYALVWAFEGRQMPVAVEAVSVSTGERLRQNPTISQLQEVADDLARLVAAFRTEWPNGVEPTRSGGPWCRYCPLLLECSEGAVAIAINQ